MIKWSK